MNVRLVLKTMGKLLVLEAILLLLPLLVSLIAKENTWLSFVTPIACLVGVGLPLSFIKLKERKMYIREGFVIVAFTWILYSLVGAVPFVMSGSIPKYENALFEMVSGFTTTGASILSNVEALPKSMLFWRSFSHWIGGMGVLVFVLAILPKSDSGAVHMFRAESPGPNVGKLVSKLKSTALILYAIYAVMTLVMFVMLAPCPEVSAFDSLLISFGTAGTGGFAPTSASIGAYNSVYVEMVVAVFMFLFSLNFNFYYLLLMRQFKKAFRSEEIIGYFAIVVGATLAIALNIMDSCANFGEAIRYSFFQVTSISSTTGFTSLDYNSWPLFSKVLILMLTAIGACAGSTGGGLKMARMIIMGKSTVGDIRKLSRPRQVITLRYEGEVLDDATVRNTRVVVVSWLFCLVGTTLLLSLDSYANGDMLTNFSAALTCLANVGPGLNGVGPAANFSGFSTFSKLMLSFDMLAGRLEFLPIIALFRPKTWTRA